MALAVAPRRLWGWLNDAKTRKWMSILTLAAAWLVLLLVLVWTGMAVTQPSSARCSNAPARVTSIPQLTEVVICVAGFVLGRLTARPKIRRRRELMDSTVEREGLPLPRADVKRARAGVWAQASLTAALLLITFLLAFETLTLALSVWPITYYTRCANEAAPLRTVAGAFAFCFLAGRWLWLPETPKDET
jgi:hypothetical protein